MGLSYQPASARPTQVLLAEGDKVSLTHLQDLLRKSGYDVAVADDGAQALEILQSGNPPTLAILDWTMPGLSGIEICRRLRNTNQRRFTYVLLLTRWNEQNDRVAALEAGADDCLFKPVETRELRVRLQIGAQVILERALRESAERFRSAFECAGIGMAVVGLDGAFQQVNRAFCELLRRTPNELLGMNLHEISSPGDSPTSQILLQQLLEGQRQSGEFERKYSTKAGPFAWTSSTVSVVLDSDDCPVSFVLQVQDIAQRKGLEDQLRQAQKLEAIGQLAAGIAHEINTPTQYVGDNIRFLKESWSSVAEFLNFCATLHSQARDHPASPDPLQQLGQLYVKCDFDYLIKEIPHAIDQSLEGLQRVSKIVRGMKEFSHPGSKEKHAVNINKAIETTITVAHHEWKYCAEVVTEFDEALPLVPCLIGEFNQVMLNLIINSAHAIAASASTSQKERGTIKITTSRSGEWAEIAISDTGMGIPADIKPRIFEPFFTTKDVGKGTGQGLALAHSVIVNRHQGKIWFDSEPGRGATFFIRLPLDIGMAVT